MDALPPDILAILEDIADDIQCLTELLATPDTPPDGGTTDAS